MAGNSYFLQPIWMRLIRQVNKDHAVNYQCDSVGTRLNYEVLDEAIQCICSGVPLPKSWKSKIEKRK